MEPLVPLPLAELPALPPLALAVVGHVEMVSFIGVDHLPAAGEILHAADFCELPAGGGAVVAVQMARLTGERIPFFTALGDDPLGRRAAEELEGLGLELHIAWREAPTRRGLTFIDADGERTITVIGERLMPTGADGLPWERLAQTDGVFVTATDAGGLRLARRARVLAATPRLRLPTLRQAGVTLDALIGSATDPGEAYRSEDLDPLPRLCIGTEADRGGVLMPGGRYAAGPCPGPVRDAYGAGDSFAAGVTTALAAGWDLRQAISLGAHCGAACLDGRGPYATQLRLIRR
ncbi:PfkB family carbohydrate kinase [Cyanobium gracile UHCC 0139]|uniref:PfkB family carbohydrate kinase n=1 Tax=Cyanobium gracile UHCC 0139 TaxID=3110308 RepID=A0ABU5RXX9_9CYAN|nr:PfkB family carbohydrate kinase [Cyanobium gracile]MEA5392619.1 PfkB family carbohydrate kinase [Cyanobium gracile UHCC 0139]